LPDEAKDALHSLWRRPGVNEFVMKLWLASHISF